MLHCERGHVSVHCERTEGLSFDQVATEDRPVTLPGSQDHYSRMRKKIPDDSCRLLNQQGMAEGPGIGDYPDKGGDRLPRESEELSGRE